MKWTVNVVPATEAHLESLARHMRPADIAECWRCSGSNPRQAAANALEQSLFAWSWLEEGRTACMWGLAVPNVVGRIAIPWCLTADLVEKYPRAFLRNCKVAFDEALRLYPELANLVDARHEHSIRWLEWMGFTIDPPLPLGTFGHEFRRFHRGA